MGRKPGKGNALAERLPSTGGHSPQGTGPGQPTLERGRLSNAQPMGGPGSGTRPGGQLLRPFCLCFNSHTFRNWSGGVGVGLAWVSRHHAPPPTWPNFLDSWWEPVTRLESQDRGAGRALGLSTS